MSKCVAVIICDKLKVSFSLCSQKFSYIFNYFFVWNRHFHKLRTWLRFWGHGKLICTRCTSYTTMTLQMCDHSIEYNILLCNLITSSIKSCSNELNLKHLCQKNATFINAATQHWQGSFYCTVPPFTFHTVSTLLKILVHFYLPSCSGLSAFFFKPLSWYHKLVVYLALYEVQISHLPLLLAAYISLSDA